MNGLCPDCKQPWDGRLRCPHCGLQQEDLEAAADLYDRLVKEKK